jgi:hypothetical protein
MTDIVKIENEGIVMAEFNHVIGPQEARLNVTYGGQNGDLVDPINFDANDVDIKRWATEAVRAGNIPGINADPNVNFTDFVVDRFSAKDDLPNRVALRPKVPFGHLGRISNT